MAEEIRLSALDRKILTYLNRYGSKSATQIARHLKVRYTQVWTYLKDLVNRGYVIMYSRRASRYKFYRINIKNKELMKELEDGE